MEGNTSRNPNPSEFAIPEHEAYAMTHISIWEVVNFLMTKLEPVSLEELDPDDCKCAICHGEFRASEDEKLSHLPVKTVCGHIFGKPCIINWLDPLCYWGLAEGADPRIHHLTMDSIQDAKTNCPACRRVFFPMVFREPMHSLASRLWFWDSVYDFVGVARSDKEEWTRTDLWKYVKYCQSINEFKLSRTLQRKLLRRSQAALLDFALRLQDQALTPFQEDLRKVMEHLGEADLRHVIQVGSSLDYVFSGEYYIVRVDEDEDENEVEEDEDEAEDEEDEEEVEDEEDDEVEDEENYQPIQPRPDGLIFDPNPWRNDEQPPEVILPDLEQQQVRERQLSFYRYYQQHPEEDVWNLRSFAPTIQQPPEGSVSDLGQYQHDQQASGGSISNLEQHNEVEDSQPDQHHSGGS